ncbi:MAG TPA: hypothetical protein VK498_00520 [Ferruginibacter sp.]|nr:hypothetical protein [Ferruginibacter sp.]
MYQGYIDWIDLLLVPVYFVLLYAVMLWIKKKNPDNLLIRKYLLPGFKFKIICALFYSMLMYFYYGLGDSMGYYKEVLSMQQLIANGNESLKILFKDFNYPQEIHDLKGGGNPGGWLLERITLVLSYIGLSRFLVTTMLFATLAYSGIFKMLEVFVELMPEWHKRVALIVLFFPTVSIYGSGILKDTLCMAAMGWLVYASHRLFVKKHFSLKNIFILLLSFTIIFIVKIYILAALVVPYVLFLILALVKKINSGFIRRVILPFLLGLVILVYIPLAEKIDNSLGIYAIEKLFDTMKDQQASYLKSEEAESGSTFDIGPMEPSLSGFLKKAPAGITATFFRPFMWESGKIMMLFSALESLIILLFTLYVLWSAGLLRFINQLFKDPFILLCMSFSFIFGALVGITTLNFGTLARYRIPAIPFYLIGLLSILYYVKVVKVKKQHESIA